MLTEQDIRDLYKVVNHYCKRVEELEELVARLQGKKKKCVIIEMKPKINKL